MDLMTHAFKKNCPQVFVLGAGGQTSETPTASKKL